MSRVEDVHTFGWRRQLPDQRDRVFALAAPMPTPLRVDLRSKMPPVWHQGQVSSCFPPGTLVRMADGSERPIQDVRPLEEVVTAEGNVGVVSAVMARQESGGLVRLLAWGHSHLRMTRDHKVLTTRGYVRVTDLEVGDEVAMPRYSAPAVASIATAPFLAGVSKNLPRAKRWEGVAGRPGLNILSNAVPDKVALTPGFGRLIGLFLAEGCCHGSSVTWTFGIHEMDTLVADTVRLLRSELDVSGHVAPKPKNNSVNVSVYGKNWVSLFSGLCGNGAGAKRLAPALTQGGPEVLEAILRGWLDGDGWHYERRGRKRAMDHGVTISHELAIGMFDIAQALGKHPALNWQPGLVNSAAKRRQPRWTLSLAETDLRCRQTETHVWRKVRSIELEEYVGPVYDLTVEGDHSYVAEGIGVHNCTGHAVGAAVVVARAKAKTPYFDPSRLFLYYNGRVLEGTTGSDDGAVIRDVVKQASKRGVAPETLWAYNPARVLTEPTKKAYAEASKHLITSYAAVPQEIGSIRACLAQGFPIVFGFSVYESFESPAVAKSGTVAMPSATESLMGGHAVLAVGYDDSTRRLIVRNSWGAKWGNKGYFTMPYEYALSPGLAADFWTLRVGA